LHYINLDQPLGVPAVALRLRLAISLAILLRLDRVLVTAIRILHRTLRLVRLASDPKDAVPASSSVWAFCPGELRLIFPTFTVKTEMLLFAVSRPDFCRATYMYQRSHSFLVVVTARTVSLPHVGSSLGV